MNTKREIIESYCVVIKKIINYLHKNTTNVKADSYRNRALIFVNNTPGMVLEITGPILFKINNDIKIGNPDDIINDMHKAKNEIPSSAVETHFIVSNIIGILDKAPPEDKTVLIKDLQFIANLYIQYLILLKE